MLQAVSKLFSTLFGNFSSSDKDCSTMTATATATKADTAAPTTQTTATVGGQMNGRSQTSQTRTAQTITMTEMNGS